MIRLEGSNNENKKKKKVLETLECGNGSALDSNARSSSCQEYSGAS